MNADVGVSLAAGYADEYVFYLYENRYNSLSPILGKGGYFEFRDFQIKKSSKISCGMGVLARERGEKSSKISCGTGVLARERGEAGETPAPQKVEFIS
ncbi:MAG: hypothetical protein SAK29_34370 [Scytonema sp. PMC 1069.18]|nr:hypothetical protein [Scytonema sp. PMC 1069.18]MEC4887395.1 hypothetical protein [Scytonema sp. PMC 1070.18]